MDSWKKSPANFSVYKETITTISGEYEDVVIEEGYDEAEDEGLTYDEFYDEYERDPEYSDDVTERQWVETEEVSHYYKVTETETVNKWIEEETKDIEVLGTLDEMVKNIKEIEEENKSTYTDKYSHTMKIRLGESVVMPRRDCNGDPKKECSYGLHVGATKYVENFIDAYITRRSVSNESPVLVCLVNPMNVVAVPEYDNSKMRVSEYFPFAKGTVESFENDHTIKIVEQKYFSNDYRNIEKTKLEELLESIKKDEEVRETAQNVVTDDREREEYAEILKSRVVDLTDSELTVYDAFGLKE